MIPISVLMSVHNGLPYVGHAVDSVLKQDFQKFEFLIIDDASTDGTTSELQHFAERDSRVRLLTNPINIGLTRSLNRGLEEAKGELIARIDADDLCLQGRLRVQSEFLCAHPQCALVTSTARFIDENDRQLPPDRSWHSRDSLLAELFFRNPIIHSSVMFRRDVILAVGGYDSKFDRAQDYDLWLRLLKENKSIEMLEEPLVCHRIHSNRVTARQSELMEKCRITALSSAYRDILGMTPPDHWFADVETLNSCDPVVHGEIRHLASSFRTLAKLFRIRYRERHEAIGHLEREIAKCVSRRLGHSTSAALRQFWINYSCGFSISKSALEFGWTECVGYATRMRSQLGWIKRNLLRPGGRR